jgi:hypothetical protein
MQGEYDGRHLDQHEVTLTRSQITRSNTYVLN